jgi:hemerythrin-like domain-containing protein
MSRAMEVLRGDHKIFFQLLDMIEQEIDVFGRAEQPDYTLLEAILEYFRGYPYCAHRPAEHLVYDKLKLRAPELCADIPDPGDEHDLETQRLDALRRLVGMVLSESEIPRETVIHAARAFVHHMRRHLEMEEGRFLPAALATLQAEDWIEIDERLSECRPLEPGNGTVEQFDDLRQDIMSWCADRPELQRQEA